MGPGDNEDHPCRRQQHQQHGPRARRDLVTKQLHPDLKVRFLRIGFRMVLLHRGVGGEQLSASLIESSSGSETAEKLRNAMDAASAHGCEKLGGVVHNVTL